jgi:hypothetical protein
MTLFTWKGVSGDWNLARDWRPSGGPPTASDAARINGSATDAITVGTADVVDSLTLSDPNATLNDVGSSASLTIGGTLSMSNGTLNISPGFDFGVLTVGALNLSGGALTLNYFGQLNLNGTLSQTGGTLTLSGSISGGTIDSTAGALVFGGVTLNAVTFDGPLNLTAGMGVELANGTTVVGSSGSGSGTIIATGIGSYLGFGYGQTVSNTTINLGSAGVGSTLGVWDTTLASSSTVDVVGNANISASGPVNEHAIDLVNEGVIDQTGSGGTLTIYLNMTFTNSGVIDAEAKGGLLDVRQTTLTNNGAIDVANGDTFTIVFGTLTNLRAHTLTGGTYEAQAGSAMEIIGNDTITTDDATIILSGAGSAIEALSANVYSPVDTTLTTIGASGEFELLSGRNWTTAGAPITNDGIIELGGGTLTATAPGASVTDAAGSELNGFGTVTATTFVNSGTIEASGGTLEVTGAVTGKGTDTISGAATLEFGAAVSSAKTLGDQDIGFSGGGTLHLLKPASFYGEISDFGAGDRVEILGSWAFPAISHAGDVTTLTLTKGATKHAFEFAGDYTRSDFSIASGKTTTIGFA